jgi:hypothetical protein
MTGHRPSTAPRLLYAVLLVVIQVISAGVAGG